MSKTTNYVIAAVVGAVLVIAGGWFKVSPTQIVYDNEGKPTAVGALVGPILNYDYFGFGGILKRASHPSFATATSTLCVSNATVATSTWRYSAMVTSSTGTPVYLMAEATTIPYAPPIAAATSSLLGPAVLYAANTVGAFFNYATTTAGIDGNVIGPNKYVVVHAKNGGGGTISQGGAGTVMGGACTFEFTEL